jgi:hypothetical protein
LPASDITPTPPDRFFDFIRKKTAPLRGAMEFGHCGCRGAAQELPNATPKGCEKN